MFTRQEASRSRHEFWTTFGKYMSPIPSAEGVSINWVNYHTRLKHVYFRMDTAPASAVISISIEHPDPMAQALYFERFLELKMLLHETLEEEWTWRSQEVNADGKVLSRIFKEIPDVSVFNKDHWPALISFFKPRIIALDSFWADAKYSFQ